MLSRPKGSKNKKTLLEEAKLGERIAEQKALKKKLEAEERRLSASLEETKTKLKLKRREIRTAERMIASMETRKERADADAAQAVQKEEIEKAVASLMSSGRDAGEILDMLKK